MNSQSRDPHAPRSLSRRHLIRWGGGIGAVAVISGVGWFATAASPTKATAAAATPTAAPPLGPTARGVVRPRAWSRVAAQIGGVITVAPGSESGDLVRDGQTLARVRSPLDGTTEVIAAPRTGTITARAISAGDTVMPGTTLFVVADTTAMRIETTDVDEYLIARIHNGQRALVAIPALELSNLAAVTRSVGAQPVGASVPDAMSASPTDHYPVSIELIDVVPFLRIGMAARVTFLERRREDDDQ